MNYTYMTETPLKRLLFELSIPAILSMLVTNIYNMADTAFVGTLGTSQSGAVGIVFGYMAILQAIGFMCGHGSGTILSRSLGKKDILTASRTGSTGFFLSLFLGFFTGILSLIFLDPLVMLLGSTKTIFPYAKTYIFFIILSSGFMTSSLTLNNLLRYEGLAKFAMVGLMSGAVLNIFGDMLLIFVFHLGILGAGASTAISQTVSFFILLSMYIRKKTVSTISAKLFMFSLREILNILVTGFPSLIRQTLNSLSTIVLNSSASVYGDAAVAAMSISSRVTFFVTSVAIGTGQGFQPIAAFNFGAGKFSRVKRSYFFTIFAAMLLLIILDIPCLLLTDRIVLIFRDDPLVKELSVRALRLSLIGLIFMPFSTVTEMGLQSIGLRLFASIASSLRSGILLIPLILILSKTRGFSGIQEAQPLAMLLAAFISVFLSRKFLSCLNLKEN